MVRVDLVSILPLSGSPRAPVGLLVDGAGFVALDGDQEACAVDGGWPRVCDARTRYHGQGVGGCFEIHKKFLFTHAGHYPTHITGIFQIYLKQIL